MLCYNVAMRSGEMRDLHWNGGNNGDWVEDDNGDILPVDDFIDLNDPAGEEWNNADASTDECDISSENQNKTSQRRRRRVRAVSGVATLAANLFDDLDAPKSAANNRGDENIQNSQNGRASQTGQDGSNGRSVKTSSSRQPEGKRGRRVSHRDLDMDSKRYGDLADLLPLKDRKSPAARSAYIAYLSSLLAETQRALDDLRDTEAYKREVEEYDRQIDEANENYQFQPRLTKALRSEAQAERRISALRRRIEELRQQDK